MLKHYLKVRNSLQMVLIMLLLPNKLSMCLLLIKMFNNFYPKIGGKTNTTQMVIVNSMTFIMK